MNRRSAIRGLPPAVLPVLALVTAACATTINPTAQPTTTVGPAPTRPFAQGTPQTSPPAPPPTPAAPAPSPLQPATVPQPVPPEGLAVAPERARVDLEMPTFSNPTEITNPLFPISSQASVLMLGRVDDLPFRTEVTLLPYTRVFDWQGHRVETAVSQYNAYLGGRIAEVAYDFYAQADDGSVWYFGEDVFDFADGAIVSTEGTWHAGEDAPAAMIMPGRPSVGDVYRPENAPGFVFEEVTVRAVDERLDGPLGPIMGGLLAHELHADGETEDKIFAPGYGEFLTGGGGDLEALALAVPTDAMSGPVPAELLDISGGALRAFDLAGSGRWTRAVDVVAEISAAWARHPKADVPAPIKPLMAQAIKRLQGAVETRSTARARAASIHVARLAYDLQLRHRPATQVDLARFDLWAAQVLVDAAADDADGVRADVFALDYTRDRFVHTLQARDAVRLNTHLGTLQAAVIDDDLDASTEVAAELRALVRMLPPAG